MASRPASGNVESVNVIVSDDRDHESSERHYQGLNAGGTPGRYVVGGLVASPGPFILNHEDGVAVTGASRSRRERDCMVVRTATAPNTPASAHQKDADERRMPPTPSITFSDR